MKKDLLQGLCLVTDRKVGNGAGLIACLREALTAGVKAVQLREKDLPGGELLRLAKELRSLTAEFGAALIVNDRVDVALSAGADGVHLGQNSVSPKDVRSVTKERLVIGVSTHSIEEAARAEDD
ncbi:MAG: thiamine phosphate synthase, partial [Deltaproteobacteria bacterium]|nr:thiamine phosphate synthase [Deltaproteobacteria bacterium]